MAEIPNEAILICMLFEAVGVPKIDVLEMTDDEVYEYIESHPFDEETGHMAVDKEIATFLLENLGYNRAAKIFRSFPSWYA